MKMLRLILTICLLLICINITCAQEKKEYTVHEIKNMIEQSEALYSDGKYDECKELLDSLITEFESGKAHFPFNTFAYVYLHRAYISYAFREEGYEAEIEALLFKAIELNLDLEIEDPAVIPPYIFELFITMKKEYLAQYSRSSRRHNLGIFGALILEPTIISDPLRIQPGIHYAFNLDDVLTLALDIRFPLELPIWNYLRGQIGLVWYPYFRVEQFITGISTYYLFALDDLSTYTHSLSICGQAEFVFRFGLGLAASVELFRLDFILGLEEEMELPDYGSVGIIGNMLRLSFANMNFYVFLTF